ncbi:MAG: glycosyltransferase family 4 protein [Spirochaetales bacterium]|nr:glycosyltransferase family 4 protein [Spirochaetales bacterium]
MDILIITTEFPPYVGGVGTYSLTLSRALSAFENNVTILTRSYNTRTQWELDRSLKKKKIHCIRLQWIRRISLLFWKKKILRHLEQKAYDLVILCNDGAQMICSNRKITNRLNKYIVVIHGTEIARYFERRININFLFYNRKGIIRLLNNAFKVVAISNSTKEWLAEHITLDNIHVILNCIDTDLFYYDEQFNQKRTALLDTYHIKTTDRILLSASRLVEEKGQDILITVFSKLILKYNNIKLIICSDGPHRKKLERLVNNLHLKGSVIFTGKVSVDTLRDLYQLADIFILLSRQGRKEGFGLVYLEANACKTPVIGSDMAGVKDAITNDVNGLRVNPCDRTEIQEKIEILLDNETLRKKLAEKGYDRVIKYFNAKRLARDFLSL